MKTVDCRKPGFWVLTVAMVSIVVLAVCFLTNPKNTQLLAPEPFGHTYRVREIVYDAPQFSFTYTPESAPLFTLTADFAYATKASPLEDWQIGGGFREMTLTKENFDDCFRLIEGTSGWRTAQFLSETQLLKEHQRAAETMRRENRKAWQLESGESMILVLQQKNGDMYLAQGYPAGQGTSSPGFDFAMIRWLFKLERVKEEEMPSSLTGASLTSDGNEAPDQTSGDGNKSPGQTSGDAMTEYTSGVCLYLTPLSSSLPVDDTGYRYFISEKQLLITDRATGEVIEDISLADKSGKAISESEWAALFMVDIGLLDIAVYDNPQMMVLSDRLLLLHMDGELWLGQYHGEKVGMWSLHSLALENNTPVTWQYMPLLSSRYPAFPFRFDLPHTRILAECSGGRLIGYDDHDGTAYPQGQSLTVPAGSAVYWSPNEKDGSLETAHNARIDFSVYEGNTLIHTGAISIAATAGFGTETTTYKGVMVSGEGMEMQQAAESEGAVIVRRIRNDDE